MENPTETPDFLAMTLRPIIPGTGQTLTHLLSKSLGVCFDAYLWGVNEATDFTHAGMTDEEFKKEVGGQLAHPDPAPELLIKEWTDNREAMTKVVSEALGLLLKELQTKAGLVIGTPDVKYYRDLNDKDVIRGSDEFNYDGWQECQWESPEEVGKTVGEVNAQISDALQYRREIKAFIDA